MDERTSRRHRIAVVAKYGQHFGEYGYRLSSTVGYSPVDETGGARFDTVVGRSWRPAPYMRVLR
jgi:hypothetical protein